MNFFFNKKQVFYRNKDSLVCNSRFFLSIVQSSVESVEGDDASLMNEVSSSLNARQISGLQFNRFFWLSQYVKNLRFGSSVFMVILEPFLDDEELKYSLYSGLLLSKSLSLNSISLVLRQSLGGSSVERTFFLNATNFILIKKI